MSPRRRFLVTAVLLAAAVQPSQAVGSPAAEDRAVARAVARSFTVTASFTDPSVLLRERTALKGTVRPVRDTKVLVQRRTKDGWTTVARRGLDDKGRYRYAFKALTPGDHVYRAKVPKVGAVRAGTSPKRTLTVAEQALVVFRIPAGTGAADWNTADTTVKAIVGDTLRLVNDDSMPHRLHTDGAPFSHPASDLAPGASEDFVLESAYDSGPQPPLYCHVHGPGSEFWIDVTA